MRSESEDYRILVGLHQSFYYEKEQFERSIQSSRDKRRFFCTSVVFIFLLLDMVAIYFVGKIMTKTDEPVYGLMVLCMLIAWFVVTVSVAAISLIPVIMLLDGIRERAEKPIVDKWRETSASLLRDMKDIFWDEENYFRDGSSRSHYDILGIEECEYNEILKSENKDSSEYQMIQKLIFVEKDIQNISDSL